MTQPHLRPPTTLQPQPKANPTSSSSSIAHPISIRTPQQSRVSSENRQSSSRAPLVEESTSEKATTNLIRRVLCSQQSSDPRPIQELLPPLSSSNETDLQLYAIIAILVKELVYSWYGKITPDQAFVEEVVRIIAHCTRALEGRLRKIDLEALVLDEIPQLIENHILTYRSSHSTTVLQQEHRNPRSIYHALAPHTALSPVPDPSSEDSISRQLKNESDYRQLLVQGTLAVLLPTEDLENVCLRTLVADVFAETILGNSIGGKVCESWFIWTGITKLVEAVKASVSPRATGEEMEVDTRSRLEKFGLLSERGQHDTRPSRDGQRSAFSEVFWRVVQYGYLMMVSVRFVVIGLVASWSEPRRSSSSSSWQAAAATDSPIVKSPQAPGHAVILRPMLDSKIFSLISTILDLSFRMPWLSGWAALLHHHLTRSAIGLLRVGAADGLLDQYIHHLFTTHLLRSSLLPPLLATLRTTLFPRNALLTPTPSPFPPPSSSSQPSPQHPSPSQLNEIKHQTASALSSLLPSKVLKTSSDEVVQEIETELEVWNDTYLNKHVAFRILEAVLVKLIPEMGERGVGELMEMRGVVS